MKYALGTWRPDRPDYVAGRRQSLAVVDCENFIRQSGRWEPINRAFPSLDAEALPDSPIRSWQFKFTNGFSVVFVEAEDGHLYVKNGDEWDVATLAACTLRWSLDQWGDVIYATTAGQQLQKWEPPGTANEDTPQFAIVPDSPSGAQIVRTFREFLVLANFGGDGFNIVQWSGLNRPEEWVAGANFSDNQELFELGEIHDIITYEEAYLICARGISRMSQLGADFVFQFDTVTREYGVELAGASIAIDRFIWIGSTAGFIRFGLDGNILHIGEGRVDDTFRNLLDEEASKGVFTYYDEVKKTIRWSFPSRQPYHPDTTLIYSMESQSWGRDITEHPVLFVETSTPMSWETMCDRWGETIAEIFEVLISFLDPRLEGGIDLLYGFDDDRKAGPTSVRHDLSVLTTCLFSPWVEGRTRTLVTGIRPWTDGTPEISIAAFERPVESSHHQDAYEPCEELLESGIAPAYRSGRYFQVKFDFGPTPNYTYLSGFDFEFMRDGQI